MKQAIQKAIEGGWREECRFCGFGPIAGVEFAYFKSFDGEDVQEWEMAVSSILLDPLFWQALGKAMGWGNNGVSHAIFKYVASMEKPTRARPLPPLEKDMYRYEVPAWAYHWHRFIDHLAEGKDADSFFKELLATKETK